MPRYNWPLVLEIQGLADGLQMSKSCRMRPQMLQRSEVCGVSAAVAECTRTSVAGGFFVVSCSDQVAWVTAGTPAAE